MRENWDDLRFVLAVVDRGTVSGAARALGVNHATVLRRIAQFEGRAGCAVFDRAGSGYALKPEMAEMMEAAREAELALRTVEAKLEGRTAGLGGAVRLSSTDSICQCLLPEFVSKLKGLHRDLQVSILSSNGHVDMARLEADIAIRPALALADDLEGEEVAEMGFAVYEAEGGQGAWLGLGGPLERSLPGRWMRESVANGEIAARADSFLVLRDLARLGRGRALLPCLLGDAEPQLSRRDGLAPQMSVPLWVVTHKDLRQSARLRKMRGLLAQFFERKADVLMGSATGLRENARSR